MPTHPTQVLVPLALAVLTAATPNTPGAVPSAGMRLHGAASFRRGVYRLADPGGGAVQVTGSGYTLDFHGAKLQGSGSGAGLRVVGARGVTIRDAVVTGYRWGIVVERSQGVRLVDCRSSYNGDLPSGTVIDESGRQPEDQHGGGILLRDSRGCRVLRCTAHHQWDGIDVVRSDGNAIEDGDFSYNGNWGLHLWKSSRNAFRRNRAIWCTTGEGTLFQALTGWQTYDSQAVGIDHASCDNVIEENDLRFGGDGIFIRANEGPVTPGTAVPPKNSSDRNVLRNNDCSFSPNNAIEVDFVGDTVIEGNNCSDSNYGMWLGYSRGSRVRRNVCIDDSTRAVEIENGQRGLLEGNVFGWQQARPDAALVYLRQNGRDETPSGPYTVRGNLFFGAGDAVQLLKTTATVTGNRIEVPEPQPPPAGEAVVHADPYSRATERDNAVRGRRPEPRPAMRSLPPLRPGTWTVLPGFTKHGSLAPVVLVDGVPAWTRRDPDGAVRFHLPNDFWDRPAPSRVRIRALAEGTGADAAWTARIAWPADRLIVGGIAPNPAWLGQPITLTGSGLVDPVRPNGTHVLLNGKEAPLTEARPDRLVFQAPEGLVVPTRFNLIVQRGREPGAMRSWPIPFAVRIPSEKLPHLLSATFSPKALRVGDLLTVRFRVRNNLPYAVPLATRPIPSFTYDERQAWFEMGIPETPGALHLRVTSDRPAGHDPGSWPWLFGFPVERLESGEEVTVTGQIRVETPGVREFRVGLVAGGSRFIDDNAFRTRIVVRPAR